MYVLNSSQRSGDGKWFSVVGLLLISIAAIVQPQLGPFPGFTALLPVMGCVLLLIQSGSQFKFDLVGKLLSSRVLVWIGALSYSLYLWHWPVLALLRYYTSGEILSFEFTLLFIGLTLLLSMLSYYGIERAFRCNQISKNLLIAWLLLVLSALGTFQNIENLNTVFTPEPLPIEYQRYADPATICHGQMVGDCLMGDLNSKKEILVLGDSHAAMLNYFFDYLGKELGFKARIITASSCVTIPGFDYQRLPEWAHQPCLAQIEQVKSKIEYAENIFLAASWSWQLESKNFEQSLINFLNDYAPKAKKYLISQEPLLNENPQCNQRFKSLELSKKIDVNDDYLRANEHLKSLSGNYGQVKYLDLSSLAVFDNAPFYNGKLVYYDEHHLNEIGAIEYAKHALSIFKNLIPHDE